MEVEMEVEKWRFEESRDLREVGIRISWDLSSDLNKLGFEESGFE